MMKKIQEKINKKKIINKNKEMKTKLKRRSRIKMKIR